MTKTDDKKQKIHERPIDPTRNAEDLMGDTSGLTGVTRGTGKQTSAEPDEKNTPSDTTYFKGGYMQHTQTTEPTGQKKSQTSDKQYNDQTQEHMSTQRAKMNDELFSEPPKTNDDEEIMKESLTPGKDDINEAVDDDMQDIELEQVKEETANTRFTTTEEAPDMHPYNQGEQSASGSTPDPGSDDDVGKMAAEAGFDYDENHDGDGYENDEVDTAKEIDEAEEYHRTH